MFGWHVKVRGFVYPSYCLVNTILNHIGTRTILFTTNVYIDPNGNGPH